MIKSHNAGQASQSRQELWVFTVSGLVSGAHCVSVFVHEEYEQYERVVRACVCSTNFIK